MRGPFSLMASAINFLRHLRMLVAEFFKSKSVLRHTLLNDLPILIEYHFWTEFIRKFIEVVVVSVMLLPYQTLILDGSVNDVCMMDDADGMDGQVFFDQYIINELLFLAVRS